MKVYVLMYGDSESQHVNGVFTNLDQAMTLAADDRHAYIQEIELDHAYKVGFEDAGKDVLTGGSWLKCLKAEAGEKPE